MDDALLEPSLSASSFGQSFSFFSKKRLQGKTTRWVSLINSNGTARSSTVLVHWLLTAWFSASRFSCFARFWYHSNGTLGSALPNSILARPAWRTAGWIITNVTIKLGVSASVEVMVMCKESPGQPMIIWSCLWSSALTSSGQPRLGGFKESMPPAANTAQSCHITKKNGRIGETFGVFFRTSSNNTSNLKIGDPKIQNGHVLMRYIPCLEPLGNHLDLQIESSGTVASAQLIMSLPSAPCKVSSNWLSKDPISSCRMRSWVSWWRGWRCLKLKILGKTWEKPQNGHGAPSLPVACSESKRCSFVSQADSIPLFPSNTWWASRVTSWWFKIRLKCRH